MAVRFEKAFGIKLDTMLRMQTNYQIALARQRVDEIDVTRYAAR